MRTASQINKMVIVPASAAVAKGLTFTVGQITWTTGGGLTTMTSGEIQIQSRTAEESIPIALIRRTRPLMPPYRAKRVDNLDLHQALDRTDHKLLEASNLVDLILCKPSRPATPKFFDTRRPTRVPTHERLESSLTITSTTAGRTVKFKPAPPQQRTSLTV